MEQAYGGQWPKAEHYPDPYLVPALDPIHASHFQSRSVGTSNVVTLKLIYLGCHNKIFSQRADG